MRLLLVEDDVMVASGIKLGLTDAGYAVDWVGSAERAIEVSRSEVFDVTGAGDTVVATLTLAVAAGAPLPEAAMLGNLAASIVVKRFGAATTTPEELHTALLELDPRLLEQAQGKAPSADKSVQV